MKIEIDLPEVAVKLLGFIYEGESTMDKVIEKIVLEDINSMIDTCAPEIVARLAYAIGFYKLLEEKGIRTLVDPTTKKIIEDLDRKVAAEHIKGLPITE